MVPDLTGQTVDGRFHIERALGEGSMGTVWQAKTDDGEKVALKIVSEVDEALLAPQRFLREVKSLNKVVHPNIVELYDFGRDEERGVSYLAMELVAGDPLLHLTRAGRCPPALALEVVRQAALGLSVAHEAGVVHRDLKPENVMLVPRGQGIHIKILDFGLAWVHADPSLTKTGTAPGTVSYMAPEQLEGRAVDGRTDLFALGIILFEMLSSRLPFQGKNQTQIAMAVLLNPAPRVDELVSAVPRPLGLLVHRLLMKEREKRPASARDLVREIEQLQQSLTLKPLRVAHRGPSRDPVAAWGLSPL
jgi:serine/threonine-protein kinase